MKLPTSLLSTLRASLAAGLVVAAAGCPADQPEAVSVEPVPAVLPAEPTEPSEPDTIMPVRPQSDPLTEPPSKPAELIEEPRPVCKDPDAAVDPVLKGAPTEPFDACPGCGRG